MPFNIPFGIGRVNPVPLQKDYYNTSDTVYTDIAQVNSQIPQVLRYVGLTVNIGTDEYWYKNGVTNGDLILKQSGGGGGSVNSVTGTYVNNTDPSNPVVLAQNLQDTTDIGATTTNPIFINSDSGKIEITATTDNLKSAKLGVDDSSGYLYLSGPLLQNSTLKVDNIDAFTPRIHQLPNIDGNLAVSVNGTFADTAGNITLIIPDTGVQSVTGDAVDNTDPLNPVINFPSSTLNLQEVTDNGNTTTNDITIGGILQVGSYINSFGFIRTTSSFLGVGLTLAPAIGTDNTYIISVCDTFNNKFALYGTPQGYTGGSAGFENGATWILDSEQGRVKTDHLIARTDITLVAGASNGYVLTSDVNGVGTWQPSSGGGGTNYWTASGDNIFNNNIGNIGINNSSPSEKLDIIGRLKIQTGIDDDGLYVVAEESQNVRISLSREDEEGAGRIILVDASDQGTVYLNAKSGGSIGIGANPDLGINLQVNGNLRFITGAEGANKVLTSDSDGNAEWMLPSVSAGVQTVTGTLVDNTDPQNPIINDTILSKNVFVSSGTSQAYTIPAGFTLDKIIVAPPSNCNPIVSYTAGTTGDIIPQDLSTPVTATDGILYVVNLLMLTAKSVTVSSIPVGTTVTFIKMDIS